MRGKWHEAKRDGYVWTRICTDKNNKTFSSWVRILPIADGSVTTAKLDSTLQAAIGKAHEHDNKDVLDDITSDDITNWNASEKNAIVGVRYNGSLLTIDSDRIVAFSTITQTGSFYDGELAVGNGEESIEGSGVTLQSILDRLTALEEATATASDSDVEEVITETLGE